MNKILKCVYGFLIAVSVLLTFNTNAHALENWEFKITPYFWMAGLNGDVTVKGRSAEVDASFSDIFDFFNIGGMLYFEAKNINNGLGFFISPTYINLEGDLGGDLVDVDFSFDMLLIEGGVTYTVLDSSSNMNSSRSSATLDVLAGGRFWYLNTELDIDGPADILPGEFDGDQGWFDFFIGIVPIFRYDNFIFRARSDIGGFNLGFSSDFSWNLEATLGYEIKNRVIPFIGYKALYVDYDDGSGSDRFAYDTWMYGPLVGLVFKF